MKENSGETSFPPIFKLEQLDESFSRIRLDSLSSHSGKFVEEISTASVSTLMSERSGTSVDFLDNLSNSEGGKAGVPPSSLSDLDLSDLDLPDLENSNDKKVDEKDCLATFNFTLPSYQKITTSNLWTTLPNTNNEDVANITKNTSNEINEDKKNVSKNVHFASAYELDPSAFDCPGLTSDEEEEDEVGSQISGFTDDSYNEQSESISLVSSESIKQSSTLHTTNTQKSENNNTNLGNENVNKTEAITTNLDHIGIKIKRYRELTYEELKKLDVPNKSFTDPIVFNELTFNNLLKYYKYDEHTKELFFDRLALMLYALSFVVKGTGESVSTRYEAFFCSYYQISSRTFRDWTGYTFFEFMKSRYCSPYFKLVYDEINDKYIVHYNESDKTFTRLGNDMVAVRKVNTELFRRKLMGIEKKLENIEYKEELLEEKLRWLKVLSYAPKDMTEIPIQHFMYNFEYYHKVKLDSKYLGSKFIRSSFSGVIKYIFPKELEFIPQNGGSLKILCDIEGAMKETQEKIDYLRSDEYRRTLSTKKIRLTGELPPPFQRRQSKAPRVWDFPKEEINRILGDEAHVPLHKKYSKKNAASNVDKKAKPVYTGSNVLHSEDEENSDGE